MDFLVFFCFRNMSQNHSTQRQILQFIVAGLLMQVLLSTFSLVIRHFSSKYLKDLICYFSLPYLIEQPVCLTFEVTVPNTSTTCFVSCLERQYVALLCGNLIQKQQRG